MKKTVLITAALFAGSVAFAQTGEITSNRGENWLSQDGDWGLTFSANPLLNYAGNLFNGNTNNTLTGDNGGLTWLKNNDMVIRGKKLMDANTAYRGELRIGFGSNKSTEIVAQNPQPAGATETAWVDDVTKVSNMNIHLGVGLEKRVGSTRVVGVYGAMFGVGFGTQKTTYDWGNGTDANNAVARTTETKAGSTFGINLNAFAGIEWFCAPKVSLSGEYSWGLAMTSTGAGSTTTESWNGTSVVSTTVDGTAYTDDSGTHLQGKKSSFGIDTGVSGAMIGINFYFQ